MTNIDYSKPYWKYARDVLDGTIPAGQYIRLSCQRMVDWADREDIYFNYESVDKKLNLMQKLTLREGIKFNPLPYQAWIIGNIFGWYYTDEPDIRVINNVLLS